MKSAFWFLFFCAIGTGIFSIEIEHIWVLKLLLWIWLFYCIVMAFILANKD